MQGKPQKSNRLRYAHLQPPAHPCNARPITRKETLGQRFESAYWHVRSRLTQAERAGRGETPESNRGFLRLYADIHHNKSIISLIYCERVLPFRQYLAASVKVRWYVI